MSNIIQAINQRFPITYTQSTHGPHVSTFLSVRMLIRSDFAAEEI